MNCAVKTAVVVGGVVPCFRTVSDKEVATETPGKGSRRVLKQGTTPPAAANEAEFHTQVSIHPFKSSTETRGKAL